MLPKWVPAFIIISILLLPYRAPVTAAPQDQPTTELISVPMAGYLLEDVSHPGGITPDGRFVLFYSFSGNLAPGDTNYRLDVYVRDRLNSTTSRASLRSTGAQIVDYDSYPIRISHDGRYVAFETAAPNVVTGDTNNRGDAFVRDMQTGLVTRISLNASGGQHTSFSGWKLTADMRYLLFYSEADNVLPGDTNGYFDVFVRDTQTGVIERISIAHDGSQPNNHVTPQGITDDGRFVLLRSTATNLVPGDTNNLDDYFVYDRQQAQIERVSVATGGGQTSFTSGSGSAIGSDLSQDGRYAVFSTKYTGLAPGDTSQYGDVFLRDRQLDTTVCVSCPASGVFGNGNSMYPTFSYDGRYIVFSSTASNLVSGDTNGAEDVFVYDIQTGQITLLSLNNQNQPVNALSSLPFASSQAQVVIFYSNASNLAPSVSVSAVYARVNGVAAGDTTPPAAITDLAAAPGNPGELTLTWTAPGDDGNTGTAATYDLRYHTAPILNETAWNAATQATGEPAPQPAGTSQNFTLTGLPPHQTLYFAMRTTDENGNVSALSNSPSAAARAVNWLLLYYLSGDNDQSMHENAIRAFNMLETAAANPHVKMAVLWDRLGENNSNYLLVQPDSDPDHLAEYEEGVTTWTLPGDVDMADPQTLVNFIAWAHSQVQADHTALLLSDHGDGLGGAMLDITPARRVMTLPEIQSALAQAQAGGAHLDVLAMDACLMGLIEDAYQFRSLTDYYAASQALQYMYVSGYAALPNAITAATTPEQMATLFMNAYADERGSADHTLSVAEMSRLDALVSATNALAAALNTDLQANLPLIDSVLAQTLTFRQDDARRGIYIDLYDFARLLKAESGSTAIQTAAQAVMDTVSAYIGGRNRHDDAANARAGGVSIFFPNDRSSFYDPARYDFAVGADWSRPGAFTAQAPQSTATWGSLLSNYFNLTKPAGVDIAAPPELLPHQRQYFTYLPLSLQP